MPTISDLKDQARALEQQGQIEQALTIYQHILKHLEGTPAITKVLPLYVKAGDLLAKMDRNEEAVESYQTAAEHYASSGAAPRVIALCDRILRLAPGRTDVYTSFARHLIENRHVGSARDVLAEYARLTNMDRALDTLDNLAGRLSDEVLPMLERLLESFEAEEQSEQTIERVSIQLEQDTDDLAGELTGVPETAEALDVAEQTAASEEEAAEEEEKEPEAALGKEAAEEETESYEPLMPQLLDLDKMQKQSSIQRAISDDDLGETADDTPDIEHAPEAKITTDVTPTMESTPFVTEVDEPPSEYESAVDVPPKEQSATEDGGMDILLAEAMISDDVSEPDSAEDAGGAVEIERSEWQAEFPEPSAEETVAAEWSPEEELKPASQYASDEYETPEEVAEESEQEAEAAAVDSEALEDEIARAVEGAAEFAAATEESVPVEAAVPTPPPAVEQPTKREPAPPTMRRPPRPASVMVPDAAESIQKSPVMFGVGGFILGLLAGAGLTLALAGGGSDSPQTEVTTDQQSTAAETQAAPVQPPTTTQLEVAEDVPALDSAAETRADSLQAGEETEPALTEIETDTAAAGADTEEPAEPTTFGPNPIVVQGLEIEEVSEVESLGRAGFRVVHRLDWADPLVIEAYQDSTVSMSPFIQVDVTPPDTVVGVRRLDGYIVYASGVMPEDSLRSLMSRLVEGQRPPN